MKGDPVEKNPLNIVLIALGGFPFRLYIEIGQPLLIECKAGGVGPGEIGVVNAVNIGRR